MINKKLSIIYYNNNNNNNKLILKFKITLL